MRSLLVGQSGSGKSHALRLIATRALAQRVPVLVCDPHGTDWPRGCWTTDNLPRLVQVAKANTGCVVIVDEAGECIGSSGTTQEKAARWLATGSRKWGHRVWFASPGWSDIAKAYRRQCDPVVMLRQHPEDAAELAALYRCDDLLELPRLGVGEYFQAVRGEVSGPHKFPQNARESSVRRGKKPSTGNRDAGLRAADGEGSNAAHHPRRPHRRATPAQRRPSEPSP